MIPLTLPDRLVAALHVDPSGCWLWQQSTNPSGYGQVHWDGTNRLAHRIVYALLVGPVPSELHLHHTCHTPRCCNPAHLIALDSDAHAAAHVAMRDTCSNGHAWTGDNTYIRANGVRQCRACKATAQRRVYAKNPQALNLQGSERRRQRKALARAGA